MEKYNLTQTGQEVQNILNNATPQSDLAEEVERAQEAERLLGEGIQQNADDIDAIEGKIPSAATSENKLATESYVNDAVATSSATFRGTFNLVSDLSLTVDATEQQIATALAGAISTADNNDYAFVQIPTSDETPTEIAEIDRYKFNGTAWSFEYKMNNSGFTEAQWEAINSGITSELVTKLGNLPTAAALAEALASKQNVLTFDSVPTEGSNNPVKSGGVYSAIDEEKGARLNSDAALQQSIEAILLLIPTAASSLNQLADKAFVNSSISTATATFRGTFNLVNDLHLTLAATHAQIGNALALAILESDNNDYAFVQIPTVETAPNEIAQTDRYKFNGSTWEYEYTLNNSGFTSAQWTAINSGITSALVSKLSALPTNADLTTALGVLTSSITTINQKIPSAASQANQLVDTAAMESYIVQVLDVLTASFNVTSSDGHVTVQISQVDGKITSVALTTLDIASAASLSLVEGRVTTAEGIISTNSADIAILQDAYAALTQSALVIVKPTDTWPVANPATSTIYRVVDRTNTPPQYYSDYMWNGTAMVLMATYDNAIDPRPKKASLNLVTSGGVFDNIGALDVSELNATENPHKLAQYADLSAALAAIPTDYRKGGMSIKFVQSSDNKYVQYRCMAQNFTTDTTQWQGVDETPTPESPNIVKSEGVAKNELYISDFILGYIDSENKWQNIGSGRRKYAIIPLNGFDGENVIITAPSSGASVVAFLSEYNPQSDTDASCLANLTVSANNSYTGAVPAGTKYMYVLTISYSSNRVPVTLKIGEIDFLATSKDNILYLKKSIKDNIQAINNSKVPKKDEALINETKTVTSNGTLVPETKVNIKKGELIRLNVTGQSVVWSTLNVYINGTTEGGFKVLINNTLIAPFDIETIKLAITTDSFIASGDVVTTLTRYNFNTLLDDELKSNRLLFPDIYRGYIASGVWKNIGRSYRWYRIVDISGLTGSVHLVAGNAVASIYFLSSFNPVDDSSNGIISGSDYYAANTDTNIDIPNGAKYLYYLYQTSDSNRTPSVLEVGPISLLAHNNDNIKSLWENVKAGQIHGTGILDFNPSNEVTPKIINLKRPYRVYAQSPTSNCLCLLHFSDVHNSGDAMSRLKDFMDEYGTYIDDVIHTGDTFSIDLNQTLNSSWDGDWLNVIGNHDATLRIDGQYIIQPPLSSYNKLFAPYIANWGVTQPENAATNGYCYYYKDYSQGFRLIVLDCYLDGTSENNHWNATQKSWFEATLESARIAGLHIIVAVHYPVFAIPHTDNPFDSIDFSLRSGMLANAEIASCVDTFITNGGTFVCWLCGHTHFNKFGVNAEIHNGQLVVIVPTASVNAAQNYDDEERENGNKTQDCFDIMAFDKVSKTIKMMRIGADYDRYMRRKNTLSWDYQNSSLIYVDK